MASLSLGGSDAEKTKHAAVTASSPGPSLPGPRPHSPGHTAHHTHTSLPEEGPGFNGAAWNIWLCVNSTTFLCPHAIPRFLVSEVLSSQQQREVQMKDEFNEQETSITAVQRLELE
ncbi:unnamed protein product [Pleuronectes platessa]|uniref:Uncharacterized protein n=1 Tax=Pleuronectes platessa TaxID=8262 RepID=A0A9N7ZEZ2_PLEPL|nr:unnamed protein product [Pleuronectes platessa]